MRENAMLEYMHKIAIIVQPSEVVFGVLLQLTQSFKKWARPSPTHLADGDGEEASTGPAVPTI